MEKTTVRDDSSSSVTWEQLEPYVRSKAQELIQQMLEQEGTEFLGRPTPTGGASGVAGRVPQRVRQATEAGDAGRHNQCAPAAGERAGRGVRQPCAAVFARQNTRGQCDAARACT